jgi:hypothetical protein
MKVGNKTIPDYGKRQGRGRLGGNKSTDTGARVDPVPARVSRSKPKPTGGKNASEAAGQKKGTKTKSARKVATKAAKKAGGGAKKAATRAESAAKKKAASERATKKASKKSSKKATTTRKTSGPKRKVKTPGKRSVGRVKNRATRKKYG